MIFKYTGTQPIDWVGLSNVLSVSIGEVVICDFRKNTFSVNGDRGIEKVRGLLGKMNLSGYFEEVVGGTD